MTDERRARWTRLAKTPYASLSEEMKEKDREQVRESLAPFFERIARLKAQNKALLEALERAATLLDATDDFIRLNPIKEYTVRYDDADCDGSCLRDDCEMALIDSRAALKQAKEQS